MYSPSGPNHTHNCLVKSIPNDSTLLLVRFHHIWRVDKHVLPHQRCVTRCSSLLCLVRHGVEQRARRLKSVWRYAHSEFTWNTAPMAPGNGPLRLIPHWDFFDFIRGKNLNFVNGNTHGWWHVSTQLHRSSHYSRSSDLSRLWSQITTVTSMVQMQSPWDKFSRL